MLCYSWCFITLVGCSGTCQESVVNAVVVAKELQGGYSPVAYINMPDKYFVTVKYEGITTEIESVDIYFNIKNGESIKMILVRQFDKGGNPQKSYLRVLKGY